MAPVALPDVVDGRDVVAVWIGEMATKVDSLENGNFHSSQSFDGGDRTRMKFDDLEHGEVDVLDWLVQVPLRAG